MVVVGALSKHYGLGLYKIATVTINGPSSYTTGGFTVTIDGISSVDVAIATATGGYMAEATVESGNTIRVKVYYFDYAAASAGPAVEVPDGTDLSGIEITIVAIGH